jgi:hypothetical protein
MSIASNSEMKVISKKYVPNYLIILDTCWQQNKESLGAYLECKIGPIPRMRVDRANKNMARKARA